MRRTCVAAAALATALLGTVPASADTGRAAAGGWEPAPTPPYDVPAGARCDFPLHTEPVVDDVVRQVLATHPDGSAAKVAYKGDLVVRVTNSATGAFHDADAGGSAIVEYRTDGSQRWYAVGPVLAGVGENGGNLPRGMHLLDGVYTLSISADGYKTLHMVHGSTDDICSHID